MDEKKRGEQKRRKEVWKTPQIKIKKLKKDIETLETEVENLLKNVQTTPTSSCAVCKKNVGSEDLPCQHSICHPRYSNQLRNRDNVYCPICKKNYFNVRFDSISSSSSEEF